MARPVAHTRGASAAGKAGSLDESSSTTLTARVLGLMRSDILELRLEPGSKLVLEDLRDKYEVGASPLRESLSRLAVEGLVTGEDRRSYRVATITEEDFVDLTMLRQEVEVLAVTRSVERGVFGRSAGPDKGVFAGGLGLGERGVDQRWRAPR